MQDEPTILSAPDNDSSLPPGDDDPVATQKMLERLLIVTKLGLASGYISEPSDIVYLFDQTEEVRLVLRKGELLVEWSKDLSREASDFVQLLGSMEVLSGGNNGE